MKEILSVTPFSGRFLLLVFKDATEPRVFDTLLIREGKLEKLHNRAFFDSVFINTELNTVTWKGQLDLDPDVVFSHSVPLSETFISHFDVDHKKDATSVVHDMFYEVTGNVPSELAVLRLIAALPKRIVSLGECWGWYDTEVREKIYIWIKENQTTRNQQ